MVGKTWDDTADEQLLLCIIHTCAPKVEWDQVRDAMGEDLTLESLKSRFKKLKNQVKEKVGEMPAAAEKTTPVKKGTAKKITASEKKRKAAAVTAGADEDEDDVEDTPSKKVKAEDQEDGDGELV